MQNSLKNLRVLLDSINVHALIIPSTDPHKSEYINNFWKSRQWLTGFTGSAGTAVVTLNHCGLWTDSRYFIQAENELSTPWVLHKQLTKQPEYIQWLFNNLHEKQKVAINGSLFSVSEVEFLEKSLAPKQVKIIDIGDIFIDLWKNRPEKPKNKIIEHKLEFTGKTRTKKLNELKAKIKMLGSNNILISKLDDIAWLLNIRGSDIEYNPLVSAYFLINDNQYHLFIDEKKIPDNVHTKLINNGINLHAYNEVNKIFRQQKTNTSIIIDKNTLNYTLFKDIPKNYTFINGNDIVAHLKAIKNTTEIKNYENAQLRDCIALCEYLYWLEKNYNTQKITEISGADKLESLRASKSNYVGLSFGTISAFGKNAALPHYSANAKNNSIIDDTNLYLVDSGAQYLDGTTDITRTICLGKPSEQQKEDFTLVLKGHINLATAIFPKGTKGYQLDTLTREALWQKGKNYGHGAGHGIGYFLNVHEGPQGFSPEANGPAGSIITPNMLITNEPGYYLPNEYGIRIENVLLCATHSKTNSGEFLHFKTLSFCPIDTKLIKTNWLSKNEKDWINTYHKQTYSLLAPHLTSELRKWLELKTKSI